MWTPGGGWGGGSEGQRLWFGWEPWKRVNIAVGGGQSGTADGAVPNERYLPSKEACCAEQQMPVTP